VGTDRGKQDSRNVGVDERTTGAEGIGGAAGGRGEDAAVGLDYG
jgi:hypothetical protein